ncbi:hypothetical protein niasHT_015781 [Heterodera trifolii]|uniref:BED-type domain-containing protein n=1 Tax=Heterodera trifolii TaxID=157864 RepID=A0ABD2L4W0_9BILA
MEKTISPFSFLEQFSSAFSHRNPALFLNGIDQLFAVSGNSTSASTTKLGAIKEVEESEETVKSRENAEEEEGLPEKQRKRRESVPRQQKKKKGSLCDWSASSASPSSGSEEFEEEGRVDHDQSEQQLFVVNVTSLDEGPEVSQNECANGPRPSDSTSASSSSSHSSFSDHLLDHNWHFLRHHFPTSLLSSSSTIDSSTSSSNSSGGAASQSGTGGQQPQKQQQNIVSCGVSRCHTQLSPAASIAAEVQRVSIDDRGNSAFGGTIRLSPRMATQQQQAEGAQAEEGDGVSEKRNTATEGARSDRMSGRALRKHAAVEDEEQPLLLDSTCASSVSLSAVHSLAVPPGVSPSPSVSLASLLSVEQQLALAAASVPQRNNPPPPPLHQRHQIDPVTAALQLALLHHQQPQQPMQQQTERMASVKMEPQSSSSMSRDELLSSLIHSQSAVGRDQLLAAANALQQQNAMNALANLTAIMHQQHSVGVASSPVAAVSGDLRDFSMDAATVASCAASSSRLASIQEEQSGGTSPGVDIQRLFEAAGRNQSTESMASTSGGSAAPSGSAASGGAGESAGGIPRKQDIQTDIRMNRGRFQLVRKRGRSEVWNLFGQVVDMLTGQRLPYVACYACKVLYTDTGGGTGNMTRHRCSMGSSYRSSSDTTVGNESIASSVTQSSSSFESVGGVAGPVVPHGPISPQDDAAAGGQFGHFRGDQFCHQSVPRTPTAGASRETFAQSGSTGFMSGGTTSNISTATSASFDSPGTVQQYHQLHLNLGPPPMLMMSRFAAATASGSTAPPIPSCSAGPSLLSPFLPHHQPPPTQSQSLSPSTLTSPSSSSVPTRTLWPAGLGSGHHFTAADKQLFVQAMVQFCAQDMHSCEVVEGEGFKNLVETVLFIGRRSHGDPSANIFDPIRNLIPTARQLKQTFVNHEFAVRQATVRDLSMVKNDGVALSCQTLNFGGERHVTLIANYITDDWRITRRTLRVEKATDVHSFSQLLRDVLVEFQLNDAPLILLTMDSSEYGDHSEMVEQMPDNVLTMPNANMALNMILAQSLTESADFASVLALVRLCFRLISAVRETDRLGQFPPTDSLPTQWAEMADVDGQKLNYTTEVYLALKFVRQNAAAILPFLEREGIGELIAEMNKTNWKMAAELEQFLEPFHETAEIFIDSKQPHFQRIVPEWFALMHECQPQLSMDESSPFAVAASFCPEGKMPTDAMEERKLNWEKEQQQPQHNSRETERQMQGREHCRHSPAHSAPSIPNWLQSVRQAASRRLNEWAETNLRTEHRMATVLNPRPRLRQLQLICTETERAAVYERIREMVGLSRKAKAAETETKTEPFKKRRRFQEVETAATKRKDFLHRLEECAMEEEDELDIYLRTSFTQEQTQDILEFWSSIGEAQFPRLARLARFLLASSGAPCPIPLQQPSICKLGPHEIGTRLNLRPEVLNSLVHVPHQSQQVQQQQQHQQSASPME